METTTISHLPIRSKAYSIDYLRNYIIEEWTIMGVFTPLFKDERLVYHLVRKERDRYITTEMASEFVFTTAKEASEYLNSLPDETTN